MVTTATAPVLRDVTLNNDRQADEYLAENPALWRLLMPAALGFMPYDRVPELLRDELGHQLMLADVNILFTAVDRQAKPLGARYQRHR